jgi:serine/threonine protein kinase
MRPTMGRYEILTELGRGGMGTVYKARDPQINRFVAIKTISLHEPDSAEQPAYRARFLREAEAAGRLSFANLRTWIFSRPGRTHFSRVRQRYVNDLFGV